MMFNEARPPVILASGSPRRKELLASLGVPFTVVLPTVDEKDLSVAHLLPADQVEALARFKGHSIAEAYPHALVISADTIVVVENTVLGKPDNRDHAIQMLQCLQGKTHRVFTAIAGFYQEQSLSHVMETTVWIRPLTAEEIERYVQTQEPLDKAGAYAIQGYGSTLVQRIEGCYFNVVGLSLFGLNQLCQQLCPQWRIP